MENTNKKKLYVLIGIPGSGKSFIANRIAKEKEAYYVSRDEVRFSLLESGDSYFDKENLVFGEFIRRIQEQIDRGASVIADATHLNRPSRGKLLRALSLNSEIEVVGVYVKASFGLCMGRNDKREGNKKVPRSAMTSMYKNFTMPMLEEGFDKIEIIDNNWEVDV